MLKAERSPLECCWSKLMEIKQSRIDDLVSRPSESLNIEIKRWINPDESEGIAKIVKAALCDPQSKRRFLTCWL
jgi:hypothetical protein